MSLKNRDNKNRWRNKTVAFRVSPEEDEQIETAVRLSGLTKQDYITRRLMCREVVVQGNPRVYKALRNEFAAWFGDDFKALNIVTTFNLVYNAAIMVDAGIGYAITLDNLADTSADSNLCFRPLEPKLESGLNIIWKKYQVFSPAAEVFLENINRRFSPDHAAQAQLQ